MAKVIRSFKFPVRLEETCNEPAVGGKHLKDYVEKKMPQFKAVKFMAHVGKCMYCFDSLIKWHCEKVLNEIKLESRDTKSIWWGDHQNNISNNTNNDALSFNFDNFRNGQLSALETSEIFCESEIS